MNLQEIYETDKSYTKKIDKLEDEASQLEDKRSKLHSKFNSRAETEAILEML